MKEKKLILILVPVCILLMLALIGTYIFLPGVVLRKARETQAVTSETSPSPAEESYETSLADEKGDEEEIDSDSSDVNDAETDTDADTEADADEESEEAGRWEVFFDANEGEGSMQSMVVEQDVPTRLSENSFARQGFTFKNWNTKADGSGSSYANTSLVSAFEGSSPVTLFAQWAKNTLDLSTGNGWNSGMKLLTGEGQPSRETSNSAIRAIKRADRPAEGARVGIGTLTDGDVFIWYEDGTIWYYTDADKLVLNEDAVGLCMNLPALSDISGLKDWDSSHVTTMYMAFYGCSSLPNLDALSDWDTSKLENLYATFYGCSGLTDLSGLSGWNVANVRTMYATFYNCGGISTLSGLKDWDTSSLTVMQSTFSDCVGLSNLNGLKDWNVSHVETMYGIFDKCVRITELSALSAWDTSRVTSMYCAFYGCSGLTDVSGIKDWNTSNVTSLAGMFAKCENLTDATSLSSHSEDGKTAWDTGRVMQWEGIFTESGVKTMSVAPDWFAAHLSEQSQAPNGNEVQEAGSGEDGNQQAESMEAGGSEEIADNVGEASDDSGAQEQGETQPLDMAAEGDISESLDEVGETEVQQDGGDGLEASAGNSETEQGADSQDELLTQAGNPVQNGENEEGNLPPQGMDGAGPETDGSGPQVSSNTAVLPGETQEIGPGIE